MDYNFHAIKRNDNIIKAFTKNLNVNYINTYKDLNHITDNYPVIFRSMAQRKLVGLCKKQNRDYYYIDSGYIGNDNLSIKQWHRVVKNNMQHCCVNYNMPSKRFDNITSLHPHLKFNNWKKTGRSILVVTPSEKPCKFYGIDKNGWLEQTLRTLQKYTDRNIIIRDKMPRAQRISNPLRLQIEQEDIYSVVTYNSVAAIEAICAGIPVFTSALTAADDFCLKDLKNIESPLYADKEKVVKWQHWLAHCQYNFAELQSGVAFKMIKDFELS